MPYPGADIKRRGAYLGMRLIRTSGVAGIALLCLASGQVWAAPEASVLGGSPLSASSLPQPTKIQPPRLAPVHKNIRLAEPVEDPLRLDLTGDPVLSLAKPAERSSFRQAVVAAVARNPSLGEAAAQIEEAQGAKNEAWAHMGPTVDFSFSHYQVISRAFSNDSKNLIERSRPRRRTDAVGSISQPVFDFGANVARLTAADQRLNAARFGSADVATQVALRAVSSWYNVFGYRALLSLATQFLSSQRDLRTEVGHRVAQGYSAAADLVQLDAYLASTTSEIADYRRRLQTAEAQYTELVGVAPPADVERAPPPPVQYGTVEEAQADVQRMPVVLAAAAIARATRSEAKAARADQLPRVTAGADIGRYGVFENARDYDSRVTGTMSWRLFGGAKQRGEQADARQHGAQARYERILEEARRDAAIAFIDLAGLRASERAAREGYIAARRSRDVIAQRFAVSRGTLIDLVAADNAYYSAAARYILTLTELDSARYALLARTGTLIDALGLPRQVVR